MRIGYVDYDLNNFHANKYLEILRGELAGRGFTVAGATATKKSAGKRWCVEHDVPWFDSVEAMREQVDGFAVLAPSNPEKHLPLCEQTLPIGKPTFVDKTFAPDLATAKRIFALADRYKTPVQTSSPLRYTDVQAFAKEAGRARLRHVVAWGGGRSFDEYAIHPVEMVVSCLGPGAERLMRRGSAKQSQLLIDFTSGRTAVVNVCVQSKTPFAAGVTTVDETRLIPVDDSRLFVDAAAGMLDFFKRGRPLIDRRETLVVRRILDVATQTRARERFVKL